MSQKSLVQSKESFKADLQFENSQEMKNLIQVMDPIDNFVQAHNFQHDRMAMIRGFIKDHPEMKFPEDVEEAVQTIEDARLPELEAQIRQYQAKIAQLKTEIQESQAESIQLQTQIIESQAKRFKLLCCH
jgi:TolA-binding protein